jgi:tRNA (cmo5U34)-methyltransferase
MRDELFSGKIDLVDFIFDKQVVDVFDDMVRRSVPGYQSMIEMIGLIVKTYGQDNSYYYDLGASTGAVALALALNNPHQHNRIIAVDNSVEMVKNCKNNLDGKITNFDVICSDINDISCENSSIVVLNLTLQFIPVKQRQALINKIYQGLNPGGVLVVSEKIILMIPNNKQKLPNYTWTLSVPMAIAS